MKTYMIWTDFQELPEVYELDGDYRHLDDTVLNCGPTEFDQGLSEDAIERYKNRCAELNSLLFSADGVKLLKPMSLNGTSKDVATTGDEYCYIVCGIAP